MRRDAMARRVFIFRAGRWDTALTSPQVGENYKVKIEIVFNLSIQNAVIILITLATEIFSKN